MRSKDRQSRLQEAGREDREKRRTRRHQPAKNTRPRGNGEIDRDDLERGTEKLAALVGR